jgi:chaperonin GroEL
VAREIELEDPLENLGAGLGREVCSSMRAAVGGGATTAVVLTRQLVEEGLLALDAGTHPASLQRGLELALEAVLAHLKSVRLSTGDSDLLARVAAAHTGEHPDLGLRVAEAIRALGPNGSLRVEVSLAGESRLELTEGLCFEGGYLSPYFVNDPEEMQVRLDGALILVYARQDPSAEDLAAACGVAEAAARPLLVVGDELEGEALASLVVRRLQGGQEICAVRAPGFGGRQLEFLEDLALLTGATLLVGDEGRRLSTVDEAALGRAHSATVGRDATTLTFQAGARAEVERRREAAAGELTRATGSRDRERLRERLARLRGSMGVLHVGGEDEQDAAERCARAEDAVRAVRAAVEEGVVAGGGAALVRASAFAVPAGLASEEESGARILAGALLAPARAIAWNAGYEGAAVLARLLESDSATTFDARTGQFVNARDAGILDPLVVLRAALEQSVRAAIQIWTTDAVVIDEPGPPDSEAS